MRALNAYSDPFDGPQTSDHDTRCVCPICTAKREFEGIDSELDALSDESTSPCRECESEYVLDEFETDLSDREWEEEIRRRGGRFRRPSARRSRPTHRPPRPLKQRSPTKRGPFRPNRPRGTRTSPWPPKRTRRPRIIRPFLPSRRRGPVILREPATPCICPAHGTEFVRWVQSSLNRLLGLRLRVNGVMNRATRDALRRFQKQQGLAIDGIAGPETERALVDAKARQSGPSQANPVESESFDDLASELEGWESELPVNRKGRKYIRWVQRSLNRIMGTALTVDGISGRRTRGAIRAFQRHFSLKVDGIVGKQTEAVLIMLSFSVPPTAKVPSIPASGDWVIPPSVRAAGEAQYVRYDSPPAWAGSPGNCTRSFTPGARELKGYILSTFPGVSRIGGYNCRVNSANRSQTSVHGVGRALDIMIPKVSGRANHAVGDPIANWLVQNAEALGVQYIIWNRTKWNASRRGRKQGRYGGPSPHTDHIHVELNRDGARRKTAWFQRPETEAA